MKLFKFKSKLNKRLAIGKTLGLIIGLLGFLLLPVFSDNVDMNLRIGILLWYTMFGVFIAFAGIMTKHPVFKFKMSFWFRGILFGGILNLIIGFLAFDSIAALMIGTVFEGISPLRIVTEGMIIGLFIDYFATKCAGEGKELVK